MSLTLQGGAAKEGREGSGSGYPVLFFLFGFLDPVLLDLRHLLLQKLRLQTNKMHQP
jgi:hypothetical protein